jgi:hypothetical protein
MFMSFTLNKAFYIYKNYSIAEERFGGSLKSRKVIMHISFRSLLYPLSFGIFLYFYTAPGVKMFFLS